MTTIITNTYEVYFKIALYPKGVNWFHFEEIQDEVSGTMYSEFVEDSKDFNKYLCTQNQSNAVLQTLRNEYEIIALADVTIRDLEFNNNGQFNCKVEIVTEKYDELNDDEIQQIIENSIWPGYDAEPLYIFIDGEPLKMDLQLAYFVEYDDDDEEEQQDEEGDDEEGDDEEEEKEEKEENKKISPYYISSDESNEETEEDLDNCEEYN